MNFPELAASETTTIERVEFWNRQLKELGQPDLKIAAGALTEIPLSKKGWL